MGASQTPPLQIHDESRGDSLLALLPNSSVGGGSSGGGADPQVQHQGGGGNCQRSLGLLFYVVRIVSAGGAGCKRPAASQRSGGHQGAQGAASRRPHAQHGCTIAVRQCPERSGVLFCGWLCASNPWRSLASGTALGCRASQSGMIGDMHGLAASWRRPGACLLQQEQHAAGRRVECLAAHWPASPPQHVGMVCGAHDVGEMTGTVKQEPANESKHGQESRRERWRSHSGVVCTTGEAAGWLCLAYMGCAIQPPSGRQGIQKVAAWDTLEVGSRAWRSGQGSLAPAPGSRRAT